MRLLSAGPWRATISPLYRDFEKFDVELKAREFNIISKQSLENLLQRMQMSLPQ
jgi:hypothetical protein